MRDAALNPLRAYENIHAKCFVCLRFIWLPPFRLLFQRAESRTKQPWISSRIASTAQETAWRRAADTEDDLVAAKVQAQMAGALAGSQLCCTSSVHAVTPRACSGSVCSLAGSKQPCTHVFYLVPQSLGARWALSALEWRAPALMRNRDDDSLCCLRGHGCYHESMQGSF